jgi:histidinol-phosphate aminotransferase
MEIKNLVRKNVLELKPYSSARDEFEGEATVFLDANENPYPTNYNRYPDPHQKKLKALIGKIKNVDPNQIFTGNGSDEAIDLLFRAFCEPHQDNVVIPQPTYGMYTVSAAINAINVKSVNLTPDFDVAVEATLKAADAKSKLLFLCSPNNPSGNLLSFNKVIELIEKFQGIVIVDEAYIDFAGYDGFVPLLSKYSNLVILQTFSKAWGLAGLRLGICMASEEIISILNKIKPPYNIGSHTQAIAESLLKDVGIKNTEVKEIIVQRALLISQLQLLPTIVHVYPSDANFVLARIKSAREVYLSLVKKGIVVRDRSTVILCDDCLRITVGTPKENSKLIQALKEI